MQQPKGLTGLVRSKQYDDYEKDIRNQIRIRNAMFEAGYGDQLEALENGTFNHDHYHGGAHSHKAGSNHEAHDERMDEEPLPKKVQPPVPHEFLLKVDEDISGEDWNLLKIKLPEQLVEGKSGVSLTSLVAPWIEAAKTIEMYYKPGQLVCPWAPDNKKAKTSVELTFGNSSCGGLAAIYLAAKGWNVLLTEPAPERGLFEANYHRNRESIKENGNGKVLEITADILNRSGEFSTDECKGAVVREVAQKVVQHQPKLIYLVDPIINSMLVVEVPKILKQLFIELHKANQPAEAEIVDSPNQKSPISKLSVLLVHKSRNEWLDNKLKESFAEAGFVAEILNSGQEETIIGTKGVILYKLKQFV